MSVTVLSPDRQDTPQPSIAGVLRTRPEEGADPSAAAERQVGAAGQSTSCEESFAIPSSSASTATATTTTPATATTPSSCSNAQPTSTKGSSRSPARSQHRRANSESCISPPATCNSTTTLAFYDLRGRKRRFQFTSTTYHEQQGAGRRKRQRHNPHGAQPVQSGQTDASRQPATGSTTHHHINGGRVKAGGGRGGGRRGTGTHVHQPKAPNNTSSFLINDLQERETAEQKKASTASNHSTTDNPSALPMGHRPRSYSSLAAVSPVDVVDQLEDSFEEEDDSEFAAEFDNASMERIENLSRSEVNREMLSVERVNRRLHDCVDTLKSENFRLKNLLERHGITYPIPPHGGSLLGSLNKSRSSSTEGGEVDADGEEVARKVKSDERRTLSD